MIDQIKSNQTASVRACCAVLGFRRQTYYRRKQGHRPEEADDRLADLLHQITQRFVAWGFWKAFHYLPNLGHQVNHKRVYRVWKREGLHLRLPPKRSRIYRKYQQLLSPNQVNEGWAMDFVSDWVVIQSPGGYGFLIDHDIHPVFSDPGRPDQNGRHERMHKDLKARCCKPPSYNLRSQNRRMNEFVEEYNYERPHESLDMQLPGKVHEKSERAWSDKISGPEYDTELMVKKVTASGAIRWGSYEWVNISRCLIGKYLGIKKLGNRVYEVYYRNYLLGYFKEGEQVEKGKYYLQ